MGEDKPSPVYPEKDYTEKEYMGRTSEPEMADAAGRRQSVALNIVENPLKVSSAPPTPCVVLPT